MPAKHITHWIWELPNWPSFTWDMSVLGEPLANARRAQGEVAGAARLLDPSMNLAAELETLTAEGIATVAIEGETLNLHSVRSSLARRLGVPLPGNAPMSRSVEGLTGVLLDATQHYSDALTLDKLCAWQAALFPSGYSGLHQIRVGQLRGDAPMRIVSGPVEHEKIHYVAPPRERLDQEIARFLQWYNERPPDLDGLIRTAIIHGWFEVIHPFEDGNGRIGRVLVDRALAQDELRPIRLYSVSARLMGVRDSYYDALEALSRGNLDITAWLRWFLEQFTAAVRASEQTIGHVLRKARFWILHAQSPLNGRQRKALDSMLDAGPAGFVGGMTNRKYANLTKTSKATAQRDLSELVQLNCLRPTGSGRNAHYVLQD